MIGIILHYIVIEYEYERISFIVLETLKNTCFFLLFYYYCKKSTGYLPSKKHWMRLFGVLLVAGFAFEVAAVVAMFIVQEESITQNTDKICKKPIFIVMNSIAYLMIYVFLTISVVISRNVRRIIKSSNISNEPKEQFETTKAVKLLRKAIKKLW